MEEVPIRILVADDHPVVRGGLVALLRTIAGFEVVGEAADGEAAVREVQLTRPDIVLMDVRMPGLDGSKRPGGFGLPSRPPACSC